jgi:tetraacyldisaccharide 4'-kinase
MAFAGIGRPVKFFAMLAEYGAHLVGTASFPDHHMFNNREIAALKRRASAAAALLVTTEKDLVRIDGAERTGIIPIPVIATFEDTRGIEALLAPHMESVFVP